MTTRTPALVECITDMDRITALAEAWDSLANRASNAHVFQTHTWLTTWLKHHPQARPMLLVARRQERLTAALPLCMHSVGQAPLRLRVLRFAADNESDYCGALADADYPEDLGALWAELLAHKDWHLLDLRYLPSDSPLAVLASNSGGRLRLHRMQQDIAPFLDITTDWQESVPKNQRPKLLRRRRQIQETGKLTFDVASTPEQVDAMLEEFAAIHIARWQTRRETSLFQVPQRREWLRSLCHNLLAHNQLYLCRLALDDDPVSIGLYFLSGRRLLNHMVGFSETYRKFGPVHLMVMAAVEDTRARNLADVHDFGRGGEEYKLRWSHQSQTLERILIGRPSPLGLGGFWWSASVKPFVWRHYRLGTAIREFRTRLAMRRQS